MRIDHDYIKQVIDFVLDCPGPTFNILDFSAGGISYETPEFEFHMKLFVDQHLIARDDGDYGFGLLKGIDGHTSWSVLPLRLTSRGHDFAEAICEPSVWRKIKSELPGAAMSSLVSISMALAHDFLKKKLGLI